MKLKLLVALPLAVLVIAGMLWLIINWQARSVVDERIAQMLATGAYDEVSYDNLLIRLNGDLIMHNLRIRSATGEFILQDIRVSNFDYSAAFPRNLAVTVRGLQLPNGLPPLPDGSSNPLQELLDGLMIGQTLPLEVDYRHSYSPEQEFRLDSGVRLALPGAFTLQFSSLTSNLDLQAYNDADNLDDDPAAAQLQLMENLRELEIANASLQFQDQGVVAALLEDTARKYGMPVTDLRTMLGSQAGSLHLFLPENVREFAMDTGAQLASFLDGGKTLSVSVTPQLNGRLAELQTELMAAAFIGNFARIVELLDLEITAQ